MSPVVIAVIAHAMVKLVPTACTDLATWAVGMGSFVVALISLQPLAILVGAGLILLLVRRLPELLRQGKAMALVAAPVGSVDPLVLATTVATIGLTSIFLTF
jgi:chromate transport protein ChrA